MMPATAILNTDGTDDSAQLRLSGDWRADCAGRDAVIAAFERPAFRHAVLNGAEITDWDSRLIAFLVRLLSLCKKNKVEYTLTDFPDGVPSLLDLAFAVPEHTDARPPRRPRDFLVWLGETALQCRSSVGKAWDFSRRTYAAALRFAAHKAVVRKQDVLAEIQAAGAGAFPIVSLICFLIGLILAFVGSIQLKMFGAEIYVSSLVAISVTRVMGAIMTGVIMAGRTGASYAATLGSMRVNEEVDALETMGVSSFDFLVFPRVLALSLMMPLLTVYADFMGIMGGGFVGVFMLGLSPDDYFRMTLNSLTMRNIVIGIVHGAVYGVIIALCGCYQGITCGRNASAVGSATTAAVVSSIVWMTVATAVLTVIFSVCGA